MSTHLNETNSFISFKRIADQPVTSNIKLYNLFTDEFVKKCSATKLIDVIISSNSCSRFQMSINLKEVKAALFLDMPNLALGPDGVLAEVYKHIAKFLAAPLHYIF